MTLKTSVFWFVTGSQHLYGPETLKMVDEHSKTIAEELNKKHFHTAKFCLNLC